MLEKMFGNFAGADDEYYEKKILAAQMKYLIAAKAQTRVNAPVATLYAKAFA
jgi:hypothetical protein